MSGFAPARRLVFCLGLLTCGLQQTSQAAGAAAPLWGYLSVATPSETSQDVTAFAHAGMSIDRAIDVADSQHQGRVVEIGFSRQQGYTVTLATQAGLHYARLDPAGAALDATKRPAIGRAQLDAQGQRDLDALARAPVTLHQAVAAAEHLTGGRAIAAGIEQLAGIPQFYVQTVTGKTLAPVIVDPHTGRAAPPQ